MLTPTNGYQKDQDRYNMGAYDNQRWNDFYANRKGGRAAATPTYLSDREISADIAKQNALVLAWVPMVRTKLVSSSRWFTDGKTEPMVMRGTGLKRRQELKLAASIRSKTRQNYGEIDTITYSFERHGVFVHKGVGRGYPISGSGVIKNPSGKTRVAVEWFNPILDQNLPELANRIAEINADAVLKTARAHIK